MRKKRSEMTPMERVEYIMKESTWEDAEEVGVEILARCSAMHVYARKEEDYVVELTMKLTERVCKRADEWAHEKNNPFVLACASIGHQMEQKKVISINEGKKMKKEIEKYCGNCCWFFGECTDGDGCCAKHYWEESKNGRDPMLTRCDRKACVDYVDNLDKRHYMAVMLSVLRALRGTEDCRIKPHQDLTEAVDFAIEYINVFSKL